MTVQSPYLIKKRVVDDGELWGVIVENQGKKYKLPVKDMLRLILNDERTFLVDFAGQDKPSSLSVVQEKGGRFYFRTVHDKTEKNNFNKIDAIKLISSDKFKKLNSK